MTRETYEKIENIMSMWNLDEEIKDKEVLCDVSNALEEAYNLGYSNAEDDIKRR